MLKEAYDSILRRLSTYKNTSLLYTDFEDIKEYELLCDNEKAVVIYGYNNEEKRNNVLWACNSLEDFKEYIIPYIKAQDKIGFVPYVWIDELKKNGFSMYAVWCDYFCSELEKFKSDETIELATVLDAEEISNVTLSCKDDSRGFSGQTTEWTKNWITVTATDAELERAIIVDRKDGSIRGVLYVAVYGENEKATVWVREVAVRPEFRRQGIAKELIKKAFAYGLKYDAKNSFLATDECNENAIKLYKSLGFVPNAESKEYNMIKDSD